MIRVPFAVYAEFKSIVKPIVNCEPSDEKSFTSQFQKHVPCGFCYKIVCSLGDDIRPREPVIYRAESEAEDVSQIFVEMLEKDIEKIHKEFDFAKKMIFTEEDKKVHKESENCWICGLSLKKDVVRDHCHFTGKYRGAAH